MKELGDNWKLSMFSFSQINTHTHTLSILQKKSERLFFYLKIDWSELNFCAKLKCQFLFKQIQRKKKRVVISHFNLNYREFDAHVLCITSVLWAKLIEGLVIENKIAIFHRKLAKKPILFSAIEYTNHLCMSLYS